MNMCLKHSCILSQPCCCIIGQIEAIIFNYKRYAVGIKVVCVARYHMLFQLVHFNWVILISFTYINCLVTKTSWHVFFVHIHIQVSHKVCICLKRHDYQFFTSYNLATFVYNSITLCHEECWQFLQKCVYYNYRPLTPGMLWSVYVNIEPIRRVQNDTHIVICIMLL